MKRTVGTTVRGIRTPVIKEGDDVVAIVVDSLLQAARAEGFCLADRDVIGITEAFVARAQGNYVSFDDITREIDRKFSGDLAVVFPILSRNRFAPILSGIAASGRKVHLLLNYPADEVGNPLMDLDTLDESGVNPYTDTLTESRYRDIFGTEVKHPFTGLDYVDLYKQQAVNDNIRIYLTNDPRLALNYSSEVLVANVHARRRTKRLLKQAGASRVLGLDELLTAPVEGGGYNPEFGLLGSNLASENKVKLFPRDCQAVVDGVKRAIASRTGQQVEVMVYGDGAFKDPHGHIWELADPVVSPGYTAGLAGTLHEVKLKFIADNEFAALAPKELAAAVKDRIKKKKDDMGSEDSIGTTPRHLTDVLGSLCDLTSGSGDKGTPIVLIQGYFDDYSVD